MSDSKSKSAKKSDYADNIIILRSTCGKVGNTYFIQPCKDPTTGRYPDCVKPVNSRGDIILTDPERNSGNYFIKETETFKIVDGTQFNLDDPIDKANWEAIKNCPLIAPDRFAKDANGNYLIDGTMGWSSKKPRYGVAELYIDKPGLESSHRVSQMKKVHNAVSFILDDERGAEGRLLIAKLLGKHMEGVQDAEVTDYLLSIAKKNPQKIISLYTGNDTSLRLLFVDARDKHVIYVKNNLYIYADNIALGITDDAVIQWMKDPKNKKTLELIRRDVYPEQYKENTTK